MEKLATEDKGRQVYETDDNRGELCQGVEKVMVTWHDARFYSGTYKREAILDHKMALFESMGYLISRDDTTTTIAAECNDEDEYRDITLIPSGSIVSIRSLSLGSSM